MGPMIYESNKRKVFKEMAEFGSNYGGKNIVGFALKQARCMHARRV